MAAPVQLPKVFLLAVADLVLCSILNIVMLFQGIPAVALSLDDYNSTTMAGYSSSAAVAAALTKVCHCQKKMPHVSDIVKYGTATEYNLFCPFSIDLWLLPVRIGCNHQLSHSLQSMLGLMPGTENLLEDLTGAVLNVNFPSCKLADVRGMQMTHQSGACVEPK